MAISRRRRCWPHWTPEELDELRADLDESEIVNVQDLYRRRRPLRRYPRWTPEELDELRALQDAGETLTVQRRIMRKVVLANRPWWRRMLSRGKP
jgi:hypothetical protein